MTPTHECPHCARPYLRVSTNGHPPRIVVTHRPGCPISSAEDRKFKTALARELSAVGRAGN